MLILISRYRERWNRGDFIHGWFCSPRIKTGCDPWHGDSFSLLRTPEYMYSIFDGDASLTSLEYAGPISMPCGIQECLAEHSSLPYDQPAYLLSWTQQVLTNTLSSFFSIFRVTTTSQRTTVLGLFAELCRHENPYSPLCRFCWLWLDIEIEIWNLIRSLIHCSDWLAGWCNLICFTHYVLWTLQDTRVILNDLGLFNLYSSERLYFRGNGHFWWWFVKPYRLLSEA